MALHAGGADDARAAAAAVDHARRARGGRVRGRRATCRASRCRSSTVTRPDARFPPADELWAWAHVHVNRDLAGSDGELVVDRHGRRAAAARRASLGAEPGPRATRGSSARASSSRTPATTRSSCRPSRPAGSPGSASTRPTRRRATALGLGALPDRADADAASRTTTAGTSAPARVGDFEFLVRLLEPRPVDQRVGAPRHGRAATRLEPAAASPTPTLGGVLRLGGALRVAASSDSTDASRSEVERVRELGRAVPARRSRPTLAAFVNLADDYAQPRRRRQRERPTTIAATPIR